MLTTPLLKTNQSNSTPTEVQVKLAISQVLSLPSVYNSPVFILDFKIDDKEVVTGRFRDAGKPRVFSYEIADDGITFKPFVPGRMDGFDVKFWEDFSAGYSYRIDAVAKKRTEKPKCKEGVSYPCGKSCISLKKNCKTNPQDPVSKARRQKLKNTVEEVQKAKGGVAASGVGGGAGVSKEAEEVAIKVGAKQVNIVGSPDLYKELNLTHDPSLGWQVTNKNGDVLRQPKNGNLQPSHRFKEKSQAENFAKQVITKVGKLPNSKPQEQVKDKLTAKPTEVKPTPSNSRESGKAIAETKTTSKASKPKVVDPLSLTPEPQKTPEPIAKTPKNPNQKQQTSKVSKVNANKYYNDDPIKDYETFKKEIPKELARLSFEYGYDGLIPVSKIKEELKDRIDKKDFDKWAMDLQGEGDDVTLVAGSNSENDPDAIKTGFGKPRDNIRYTNEEVLKKGRTEIKRYQGQISDIKQFKTQIDSAYDELNNEAKKKGVGVDLIPIYELRRKLGDRVSRGDFNNLIVKLQQENGYTLRAGEMRGITPDRKNDSITLPDGRFRYYLEREGIM